MTDSSLGEPRKLLFCGRNTRVLRGGKMEDVDPALGNIDADEVL